jgi:hypothetical protein
MAPVDVSKVRPLGRGGEPALRPQVYGVVPPLPANAVAYGWFIVPDGSELVTIAKGIGTGLIVIERIFWTNCPFESCNLNSGALVPREVGVPAISPVFGFNDSPSGRAGEPAARLQV